MLATCPVRLKNPIDLGFITISIRRLKMLTYVYEYTTKVQLFACDTDTWDDDRIIKKVLSNENKCREFATQQNT